MVKIKLCGLSLACDIRAANELKPEYIGFVFTPKSSRYVSYEQAAELKEMLAPGIRAVGVFTDEAPERIAELLDNGVIRYWKWEPQTIVFIFRICGRDICM